MNIYRVHTLLLYLFAITSVFASYAYFNYINNLILIVLFFVSLLMPKARFNSNLFLVILVLGIISVLDHFFLFLFEGIEVTKKTSTLPFILLALYAANKSDLKVSFEKLVILNLCLLPFLFLFGGFDTYQGRIHTNLLTPNLQGMVVYFGFMVSLQNVLRKKSVGFSLLVLISSALFLILSGSRQNIIFLLIGVVFLFVPLIFSRNQFQTNIMFKKIVVVFVGGLGMFYVISASIDTLMTRFDSDSLSALSTTSTNLEYSSMERFSYINAAVKTISEFPFGVGHGNIEYAIAMFGSSSFKLTGNAHSLFAEMAITAGVLGIIVWLFILVYFSRLCLKKNVRSRYGYVPLYLFVASFTSPLMSFKFFWVVLLILEKQIRMISTEQRKNEKDIIG